MIWWVDMIAFISMSKIAPRILENDIPFVQGKYNMGGSGTIVFCGRKRYQLIASKRFDGEGEFGFTLVREHPKKEDDHAKETWFEYLIVDGKIPSFEMNECALGLQNRKFRTGTVIKLYSYQFPKGYSAFSQDLNQSINEYLFNPALPILTKDTAERYPNNNVLVTDLFGLKSRLLKEESEYLEDKFTETDEDELFGKMKISCFIFKTKIKDFDLKKSKETIQKRYFKNGMSVLFSLNGQVHGHYTSEFITRSLKMNLLKNHLLIHVDCTEMDYEFRKELFMASRDRLKDGEETQALRKHLAQRLTAKDGKLVEIEKRRKQAVEIDTSSNTQDLLKSFTKNLPLDSNLLKLLNQTFKLDLKKKSPAKKEKSHKTTKKEEQPFHPKRYPSMFKLNAKNDGETEIAKIPLEGDKTIHFQTDAEDEYFDRLDDPGDLQITILNITPNDIDGGNRPGTPKGVTEVFNVSRSNPDKGTVKISFSPKSKVKVGDAIQIKANLTAPSGDFKEIFWVKIIEPNKPKESVGKEEPEEDFLGLPQLVFAYQKIEDNRSDSATWESVESATSLSMDFKTVMVPEAEGDNLIKIFVNMESSVLMDFKGKEKNINAEQIELAHRKYYSSVYFHTIFLYTITKNKGYEVHQKIEGRNETEQVELGEFLKELFDNYYSTFILNFGGANELMAGLED